MKSFGGVMTDYSAAIAGLAVVTLVLTSAVVFALCRPSDLPALPSDR
ncbi:hypothetical protein [Parasynechococcus sp.]